MILPLAAIFLLSPHIEGGFIAGGGRLAKTPIMEMTPWVGFEHKFLTVALQAPLRFDLNTGHIRERDWDESEDFARTITSFRIDEAFHMGTLQMTFGEGALVERYFNNLDSDHARLGTEIHLGPDQWKAPVEIDLFSSRLLARPVAGGQVSFLGDPMTLRLQAAADFDAPLELQGWADDEGRLAARHQPFYSAGGEVDADFGPVTLYTAAYFQGQDDLRPGAHLGSHFTLGSDFTFESRVEGFIFHGKYDPSPFDATYGFDAWMRRLDRPFVQFSAGGKLMMAFAYKDLIRLEGQYSDADRKDSAALSTSLSIDTEAFLIQGFYNRRYVKRDDILDGDFALWAMTLAIPLGPNFLVRAIAARSPSVCPKDDGQARYILYTELFLRLEAQFSS